MRSDRAAELRQRRFDLAAKAADLARHFLLTPRSSLRVVDDGPIELLVLPHCLLKNFDRARKRADLVVALAIRHHALDLAGSHGLRDAGDPRERTRHAAGDDDCSEPCQHHGSDRDHGNKPGGALDSFIDFLVAAFGATGIELAELGKVLIECLANAAVGVVVPPFVSGRGVDLHSPPHQLAPKLLKLPDALGERLEQRLIIGPHRVLPFVHYLSDAIIERQQAVAIHFGGRNVRGHVNAAGLHNHGIDETVHELDVQGPRECRSKFIGEGGVAPGVERGDAGERHRHGGEQREDQVELGRNRQIRLPHDALR